MEIKGLSDDNILKISHIKEEDEWALKYRIDSYHNFLKLGLPDFGPKIELDFDNIISILFFILSSLTYTHNKCNNEYYSYDNCRYFTIACFVF